MNADIIIVGAGTAGCILARRLVENTDAMVLLIEAGPPYPSSALSTPLVGLRLRYLWSWPLQSVPQERLNSRRINFPMGRVVGGTSSVNAMVAAAGPPADYGAWEAVGCPGWTRGDLEACFQRAASRDGLSVLPVSSAVYESAFSSAFIQACEEDGFKRVPALTGIESETAGMFPLFQRRGGRRAAGESLRDLRRHPRLKVLTRTSVRRVLIENQKAVGVELGGQRPSGRAMASQGVVLSAGALLSPHILQRSGVGPAAVIRAAALPLLIDLPGVGTNLQDHPGAPVLVESSVKSPGRPSQWLSAAVRYALAGDGVMASNCCEAGFFIGAAPALPVVEVFTHFQTRRHPRAVELVSVLMHPSSRGTVTMAANDPWGPPLIDPRYLAEPSDGQALLEGIDRIRSIINRPALRRFGLGKELLPGIMKPDEYLREYVGTCHHPVGTCRMGSDLLAVVDPRLRARGAENLWVADNSVVPTIPGGHTAFTALMIGERAGEMIAADINRQ